VTLTTAHGHDLARYFATQQVIVQEEASLTALADHREGHVGKTT
jgi:hypothetical protein